MEYPHEYEEFATNRHKNSITEPDGTLSVGECVHALIEELYESRSAIDEERIDACFYALCELTGIDKERLDSTMNIQHYDNPSSTRPEYQYYLGYQRALQDMKKLNKKYA